MKIYLSTRALRPPFSGGATIYTIRLANELASHASVVVGLTDYGASSVESQLASGIEKVYLSGSKRSEVAAAEQAWILQARPDWCLYSYPGVLDSYKLLEGLRTAVIVYDLQHLVVPGNFTPMERWNRDRAIRRAVDEADLVFTISDFSAGEIERFYPGSAAKTTVIYGGGERDILMDERPCGNEKFLLYPANFWPHKNHETLLEAFRILRRSDSDLKLVLTGGVLSSAVPALRARLNAPGVEVRGYVSKECLSNLLGSAACLVFPSRYEGFGMPVLEAFQAGTPVACSSGGSLPEIGGDAAEYFDPLNPEDMAAAIQRAVTKRGESEWTQKAAMRAALFTFQRSAALALAAMEGAGDDRPTRRSVSPSAPGYGTVEGSAFDRFPGVDAVLTSSEALKSGVCEAADWRVVDLYLAVRLYPLCLGRLIKRSGEVTAEAIPDIYRLVAEGRLMLVDEVQEKLAGRIPRFFAAFVIAMQLALLHRTSREAMRALFTGRWG